MTEPKTINEHIDCLARLTGAPESFVGQVRLLFSTKGISLDDDATPFLKALDDAFRREESIRTGTRSVRKNLEQVERSFDRVQQAYTQQIGQLRRIQERLRSRSAGPRQPTGPARPGRRSTEVSVARSHRVLVTRPETDAVPLVPGPDEVQ